MARTFALTARPIAKGKHQRSGQRVNVRRYPPDGVEWGQQDWGTPAVPIPPTDGTWTMTTNSIDATLVSAAGATKTLADGAWHVVLFEDGGITVPNPVNWVNLEAVLVDDQPASIDIMALESGSTPTTAQLQQCITQGFGSVKWNSAIPRWDFKVS